MDNKKKSGDVSPLFLCLSTFNIYLPNVQGSSAKQTLARFARRLRLLFGFFARTLSVETETETFPGKERRAALARFDELKKQCPGIVAEMDIEKKSWER